MWFEVVEIFITMPRLSISLTEEQNERIEKLVENGEYSSKNAVVQEWLRRAEKVNQLESKVDRLEREKRLLIEDREERTELVRYAQSQRESEQHVRKRRQQNMFRRAWWFIAGEPSPDSTDTSD